MIHQETIKGQFKHESGLARRRHADLEKSEKRRRRAEEALPRSEAQYRDLVEKAGIAILIDNKEGGFRYYNRRFAALFGYSFEKMRMQSIGTLVHPDDVNRVMTFHKKRIAGRRVPSRYEFRGVKKDGSILHLEVDSVALRDGNGTRSYIWNVTNRRLMEEELVEHREHLEELVEERTLKLKKSNKQLRQEISDRKEVEQALRLSELEWQSTFDAISDWICLTDLEDNILRTNPAVGAFAGVSPAEIIGQKCCQFVHGTERQVPDCLLQKMRVTRKRERAEFRIPDSGHWVAVTVDPVEDGRGDIIGGVHIVRDITEPKRAEEVMRDSKRILSEQNIMLQEKNTALRELMEQSRAEKERVEKQVADNVDRLLLPLLSRMRNSESPGNRTFIDLVEDNLKQLTSSFGSEVSRKLLGLTPREIKICNMIRNGLKSKDVSRLLHISPKTIEKHRRNLRNKLGLTHTKQNLATYLQSM